MDDVMLLGFALFVGMLLGAFFFGGLWWTVKMGVSTSLPALWFSTSLLLRVGITLTGIYVVAGSDFKRLLACLIGFIFARIIVTKLTAKAMKWEKNHAP